MATSTPVTPVSSTGPPPSAVRARAGLGADGCLYLYKVAHAPKEWRSHWGGGWEACRLAIPDRGAPRATSEPQDVILEEELDDGRGRFIDGVPPHLLRVRQFIADADETGAVVLAVGVQAFVSIPGSGRSLVEISEVGEKQLLLLLH